MRNMRFHTFAQILILFIISMATFFMFLMTARKQFQNSGNNVDEQSEFSTTYDINDFCDGENMAYNVSFYGNSSMPTYFKKGRKFDCAFLGHLLHFNLTDKLHRIRGPIGKISDPRESNRTPFVLASDFAFYDALRATISGIKTQFGKDKRIIVYDLGGLSTQKDSQRELRSICNLEVRHLNFSMLPENVQKLKIFAWKILLLAEMFSQFDSFIYCDTSIHFLTNNYGSFFGGINNGILSDFQFPMGTHHGLKSLLCALTKGCIEPDGAQILCQHYDADQLAVDGQCHRQDQSAMNILLHNFERGLVNSDSKITPHLRYNHPRHWEVRHVLRRRQFTNENIGEKFGRNC